ncbi:hypothetical protein FGKAn22_16100 [Ferrigenium kumadai]|uniref:SH3b domain-containing protein n=1 Tax=Ferrigenium kumadai TaxID=1682490 RepID=A0AAN1W0X7_9PROT|nr:SH3 domain-containing protein [Ferrigenium kumadai]BBI99917.1 hypothetical protein FGKAn22_16100 [Ferrigenium kumadai]
MRWLLAFCLAWSVSAAHAAEIAYTVRPTEIKAKPFSDAATLSSLPQSSRVEVIARKSGWMQIRSDGATGWVRMLSLRFGDAAAQKKSGDSGLGALFSVATTGGSGSTVSTGVRGLSEEKLKNPQPNPQAMKELQRYAASRQEALNFGKSGKLATHRIDYLPPAK